MINFNRRSYTKEFLDRDDIPFDDIRKNMQELQFINTHLGGHSITIQGFKRLLTNKKSVSVCEIGCGGGDNLQAINKWCRKNKISANFTGIDINASCVAYAQSASTIENISFIISDYKLVEFHNTRPDIIFSSLFCHHFTNQELSAMMKWMKANCNIGFFVNDLHRNSLAYYFIKLATKVFSTSWLVKNDAPLSVLRGFKKNELITILKQAGVENYSVTWKWAFRYLVTVAVPPLPHPL